MKRHWYSLFCEKNTDLYQIFNLGDGNELLQLIVHSLFYFNVIVVMVLLLTVRAWSLRLLGVFACPIVCWAIVLPKLRTSYAADKQSQTWNWLSARFTDQCTNMYQASLYTKTFHLQILYAHCVRLDPLIRNARRGPASIFSNRK